jgi:hypothetical protein
MVRPLCLPFVALGRFGEAPFLGADEEPAAADEQRSEREEPEVVSGLVAHTFRLNRPEPTSIQPRKARPLIAHRQLVVRRQRTQTPSRTATQVAAWKRPSQRVFVSNPATVVFG